MGMLGIILSLIVLVVLIFRGWHMAVVSVMASLIVIIFNQMDIWESFSVSFSAQFTAFAGTWFLMFSLGSVFGKIMEKSGASIAIATSIVRCVGRQRIILVVLITTLILSYGGIGVFIIAFTMYPICMALFKEADLPKSIFPGLLLAIPATVTMSFAPGTPSVQNLIPATYFGTDIYAAPVIGIVTSILIFVLDWAFYSWVAKRCKAKGEHFIPGPNDEIIDLNDAEAAKNLPSPLAAFAPIVTLIASIFIIMQFTDESNFAVVLGMFIAIVLALVLYRGKVDVRAVLTDGTSNGLSALMVTSMIMGFGGVVQASPAFASCVEWILSLDMSPILLMFLSINVICAITGSSTGGLNIFLASLGDYLVATNINPAILHRLTCMASAGLDAMPHASGIVLANSVAKTDMVDTYKYSFVSQCIIPMIAFAVGVVLYSVGLC